MRPATGIREDRFEQEPTAFHERVRAGFLDLARAEPERFVVLDSERSVEEIETRILAESLERLDASGPKNTEPATPSGKRSGERQRCT